MLALQVRHNDLLEFQIGQDNVRRVRCKVWGKGEMLLLHVEPASPFYKAQTLLRGEAFHELWAGVRLRYVQNMRGVWKMAFDLDAAVTVKRNPDLAA